MIIRHILFVTVVVIMLTACGESENTDNSAASTVVTPSAVFTLTDQSVEIGCGKCLYHMPGLDWCNAAMLVEGKPVLIVTVPNTDHVHGLCESPHVAIVSGTIEAGEADLTKVNFQ